MDRNRVVNLSGGVHCTYRDDVFAIEIHLLLVTNLYVHISLVYADIVWILSSLAACVVHFLRVASSGESATLTRYAP